MGAGDPYITVTEPTFVARFLLDPDIETVDTVVNVDALVDLPDGSTWALTMLTVDEVGRLLARLDRFDSSSYSTVETLSGSSASPVTQPGPQS